VRDGRRAADIRRAEDEGRGAFQNQKRRIFAHGVLDLAEVTAGDIGDAHAVFWDHDALEQQAVRLVDVSHADRVAPRPARGRDGGGKRRHAGGKRCCPIAVLKLRQFLLQHRSRRVGYAAVEELVVLLGIHAVVRLERRVEMQGIHKNGRNDRIEIPLVTVCRVFQRQSIVPRCLRLLFHSKPPDMPRALRR